MFTEIRIDEFQLGNGREASSVYLFCKNNKLHNYTERGFFIISFGVSLIRDTNTQIEIIKHLKKIIPFNCRLDARLYGQNPE